MVEFEAYTNMSVFPLLSYALLLSFIYQIGKDMHFISDDSAMMMNL